MIWHLRARTGGSLCVSWRFQWPRGPFRDGGSLPGERRGVDGLRFYPFCPLTSLQAATRQTARPRSLSWEYKQRADDRASTMSPPRSLPPPALWPRRSFLPPPSISVSPSTFRPSFSIFDHVSVSLFLSLVRWLFAPWKRAEDLREILIPLCQLHSRSSRA